MSLHLLTRYGLTKAVTLPPSGDAPDIVSSASGADGALLTSHDVDMPSGSGGHILVVTRTARSSGSPTTSAPEGWEKITDGSNATGELSAFVRQADGSEGGSVTFSSSLAVSISWVSLRVSGASNSSPAEAADGEYNSSDLPSLSPTGGEAAYRWIAVYSHRRGAVISAAPTEYANLITVATGGTTTLHCGLGVADRALTAATEDPGQFTVTGSPAIEYTATIAVRPA